MKKVLNFPIVKFILHSVFCISLITSCSSDDDDKDEIKSENGDYTITVGIYILESGVYEYQNKDFVFKTQEACQTWSRTAPGDIHSSNAHEHFNAAKNTTYNPDTETITWNEFGPEVDQQSIDDTCEKGSNPAIKTANKADYTADKNIFLKIKLVEKN